MCLCVCEYGIGKVYVCALPFKLSGHVTNLSRLCALSCGVQRGTSLATTRCSTMRPLRAACHEKRCWDAPRARTRALRPLAQAKTLESWSTWPYTTARSD